MGKDLAKIKQNPKGVKFSELERIILAAGFKCVNIKGSHHVYKKGNKILTLVKPHGGTSIVIGWMLKTSSEFLRRIDR